MMAKHEHTEDAFDIIGQQTRNLSVSRNVKKPSSALNLLFNHTDEFADEKEDETVLKSVNAETENNEKRKDDVKTVCDEESSASKDNGDFLQTTGNSGSSSLTSRTKRMQEMQKMYGMQNASSTDMHLCNNVSNVSKRRGRKPKPQKFDGGIRAAVHLTLENAQSLRMRCSQRMITQSEYIADLIAGERVVEGTPEDIKPLEINRLNFGKYEVQCTIFFTKDDAEWLKNRVAYLVTNRTQYVNWMLAMDRT